MEQSLPLDQKKISSTFYKILMNTSLHPTQFKSILLINKDVRLGTMFDYLAKLAFFKNKYIVGRYTNRIKH